MRSLTRIASIASFIVLGAPAAAQLPDSARDTLTLHYVGHAIGRETYTLRLVAGGLLLAADFDYRDRGRRTHVVDTLAMTRDFSPRRLVIRRLTDTSASVETLVQANGIRATVFAHGDTTVVATPLNSFAIAGTSPVTQHLALVRYWLAHGRPHTLVVVPGGPTNDVHIELRGADTVAVPDEHVILKRYAVTGVVWGTESVWLDSRGRLAGFATAGGGGLSLEAVRQALEPAYEQLVASATRDRLAELARLSKSVRPVASGTIALTGATLVDGTGRDAVRDAVVVTSRGRIVAAGPRASVAIPDGAQRIDVTGATIIPGLWDMHAHVMQVDWAPQYLATGVTTVRDMGNEIPFELALRNQLRSGRAIGPRLLLAGLVDGPGPDAFGAVTAATPDEARAVARRYHDLGFEQLKLYDLLSPPVVGALTAEAHRLGMTVTGHVPRSLGVELTVDSGQDHIAHLPIRGEPGSDSVARIVRVLAEHRTVVDPTTSWGELLQHSTAEPVAAFQPGVDYLPPVLAQRIRAMGVRIDTATAHARLARTLAIIGELHAAGVPIVAGTDEGVPGFSVYREVELYVKAGFSPMDALRTATAVPARAMRLDADVGTVEAGKRADLVVLDRNPLEAISNVRTMRLVMHDGVLYTKAELWRAAGLSSH